MSDPHDPRPSDERAPTPSASGEPPRPDWRIRLAARLRSRGATPNGISLFAIGLA
ncbi:MAG: hypothetical protein JF591_23580, partial [Lysobacter sp.]|nr:hypothetical protein [Lysobacter sp.]